MCIHKTILYIQKKFSYQQKTCKMPLICRTSKGGILSVKGLKVFCQWKTWWRFLKVEDKKNVSWYSRPKKDFTPQKSGILFIEDPRSISTNRRIEKSYPQIIKTNFFPLDFTLRAKLPLYIERFCSHSNFVNRSDPRGLLHKIKWKVNSVKNSHSSSNAAREQVSLPRENEQICDLLFSIPEEDFSDIKNLKILFSSIKDLRKSLMQVRPSTMSFLKRKKVLKMGFCPWKT